MAESFVLEHVLPSERARLVGLCARLSGDPNAAEDLAQETLIEAWRQRARLTDPSGYAPWLSAIARNICMRWVRRKGRELARSASVSAQDESQPAIEELPDSFDVEVDLERNELAELLDRALALLPPDTRDAMIARYIEEVPLPEVAAQLGISENHVAVRIHRGKLALRKLLSTDLLDEALTFGLLASEGFQQTNIWCPLCGKYQLYGRLNPTSGELSMRCDHCSPTPGETISHAQVPEMLSGVTSFRAAVSRLLVWSETFYIDALGGRDIPCMNCGRSIQAEYCSAIDSSLPHLQGLSMRFFCPGCRNTSWTLVGTLGLFVPEGRRFWKANPRIVMLPVVELTVDNQQALRSSFRSVTTNAQIDVLFMKETAAVLDVHVTTR